MARGLSAAPPRSRWLEESLAEAFSMRGLGLLADECECNPPFPNDSRCGQPLRNYRHNLIEKYPKAGALQSETDLAAWLRANRALLDGPWDWAITPGRRSWQCSTR
jgi:hypothetical protein